MAAGLFSKAILLFCTLQAAAKDTCRDGVACDAESDPSPNNLNLSQLGPIMKSAALEGDHNLNLLQLGPAMKYAALEGDHEESQPVSRMESKFGSRKNTADDPCEPKCAKIPEKKVEEACVVAFDGVDCETVFAGISSESSIDNDEKMELIKWAIDAIGTALKNLSLAEVNATYIDTCAGCHWAQVSSSFSNTSLTQQAFKDQTVAMMQLHSNRTQLIPHEPLPSIPNPETCGMLSVATWAAVEAYKSNEELAFGDIGWTLFGERQGMNKKAEKSQYNSWMQEAGWTKDHDLSINDDDGVTFWKHTNGNCMLAFRGSDQPIELIQSFLLVTLPAAPEIVINGGVKLELFTTLEKMKQKVGGDSVYANEGLKKYFELCPEGLVTTGHSLGGGVSQMFAFFANRAGDPLGMKLPYTEGIKAAYGFGPMPAGYEKTGPNGMGRKNLANDKRADGCFPGGMYVNARKTVEKVWGKTGTKQVHKQTGTSWQLKCFGWWCSWGFHPTYGFVQEDVMGWIENVKRSYDGAGAKAAMFDKSLDFHHVKGQTFLQYGENDYETYECGDMTKWWETIPFGKPDLHGTTAYVNKAGCKVDPSAGL